MKTLLIVAHRDWASSNANKVIVDKLSKNVKDLEIRYLHDLYPDFNIDREAEQKALLAADTIVVQFPFYWYNMPAILKQWFDEVLTFNFAYGPEGDKLKGKSFLASITIGGPKESYTPTGYNHFRIEEFLKPLEQTAYLAQMKYLDPVYEHGMIYIPGVYNTLEAVEERALRQSSRIVDALKNV